MEAYAKYLNLAGFNVHVLTEGNEDIYTLWEGCHIYYVKELINFRVNKINKNDSLVNKYFKIFINYFSRYLFLDNKVNWRKRAIKKLNEIQKTVDINIVLSSYGYLSPHLIAYSIKNKCKKIKWFADFRDEMASHPLNPRIINIRLGFIEKKIAKYADYIISVSGPIIDDFKQKYDKKFLEINNGYDFEEVMEYDKQNNFTISYIGRIGIAKLDNILLALSTLKIQNKICPNFVLKIIGSNRRINTPININSNILFIEQVQHNEAIIEMTKSDVLLLVIPNNKRKGVYSGKLFDYLGINRYILALVDKNDVAAQLINVTKSGVVADYSNINEIMNSVLELYNKWLDDISPNKDWTIIKNYTRKNQVCKFIDIISGKSKI